MLRNLPVVDGLIECGAVQKAVNFKLIDIKNAERIAKAIEDALELIEQSKLTKPPEPNQ